MKIEKDKTFPYYGFYYLFEQKVECIDRKLWKCHVSTPCNVTIIPEHRYYVLLIYSTTWLLNQGGGGGVWTWSLRLDGNNMFA